MYEKDGVMYASGEAKEIKVAAVKPLVGGMILVTFTSGEQRLFDTTLLKGSAFSKLQDQTIFTNPKVEHGFVSWDNGSIDIAPETIYADGYPYKKEFTVDMPYTAV